MTETLPEKAPRPKSVGIWIRVSTEDQAKGESPEHHERRARDYAGLRGWNVREVYHLEAVSGKSVKDHPEAQRMLGHVKSGRITGLIFSKLARLARNTKELLEFADMFREHEADLISLQEAIDTSTPAGRLFYTMIAGMAQWEREEIAERTAASVPIRAKLGKPLSGSSPFGYRWENKKLVPDPVEAPVRKLLYELFREQRRLKTVARLLNDRGHRTRVRKRFTDLAVLRLLRDPTAKGKRRANYSTRPPGTSRAVFKPEDQWVWSEVEPIVSEDLWAECNAILDERRDGKKRPAKRPVHLFAGVVFCQCGQKMYVPSNSPKYICMTCRNKIPVADLEHVFQEQLRAYAFSPEQILEHLEEADGVIQEKSQLLAALAGEQEKISAEMEKVYRLYLGDRISEDGFGLKYRPLEERLRQLGDEIPRLQAELDFFKIERLSSEEIISEAKDLATRWPDLSPEDKRRIVETLVERITIGKGDEVTIGLYYLPSVSQNLAGRPRSPTSERPRPRRRRPRAR